MASYVNFTYDKRLLKRLYADEKEADCKKNGPKRDNQEEYEHRLNNRRDYSFSYCGYLMIYFASCCCCCLGRWCGPRYERRLKSYKKLELSRESLEREKDIASFLSMRRMTNLLVNIILKPHQ